DEITSKIEEAWTFLPKGNGKAFHVHHLAGPEETKESHNYLGNTSTQQQNGESVMATVVLYLSNVTQGGQILFPKAESGSSRPNDKVWSDCTVSSPITKPIKGNALLFFNLHPNTSLDPMSLHASSFDGRTFQSVVHVISLKELEKLVSRKGASVISQSVKDVVQSVVDDDRVAENKIGTSQEAACRLVEQCESLKKAHEDSDAREEASYEVKAIEQKYHSVKVHVVSGIRTICRQ
nr:probable prolyl 4-hydroxylase 12 isoform X2 [Tanacetum cinerariifolium]